MQNSKNIIIFYGFVTHSSKEKPHRVSVENVTHTLLCKIVTSKLTYLMDELHEKTKQTRRISTGHIRYQNGFRRMQSNLLRVHGKEKNN